MNFEIPWRLVDFIAVAFLLFVLSWMTQRRIANTRRLLTKVTSRPVPTMAAMKTPKPMTRDGGPPLVTTLHG